MDDIYLESEEDRNKGGWCATCGLCCGFNLFYMPKTKSCCNPISLIRKIIWTILGIICVILMYRWFWTKLGHGIYQRHTYESRNTIIYKLSNIHDVIPVHQFMYFETEEIKDHIRCLNDQDCVKVDYKKCQTMEVTSVEFEQCMIKVLNVGQGRRLSAETDKFCTDHYNDKSIWTGDLSPSTEAFYNRKYACNNTPKGKDYCLELNKNLPD